MAMVDGVDITPDNIFNFQLQSSLLGNANNALIKGTIRYRNSGMFLSYSFNYNLHQGMNNIGSDMVHPQWQFSTPALQELFLTFKKLPAGVYEYCVTVTPVSKGASEPKPGDVYSECAYHQSDEVFLINLLDPDNNARIHEYNPPLSWVVNFPFASELTYRIRVAEIKQGQNPQNAITRNNAIYDESNLMQNSIIYPVYAKPLQVNQPYAWSVNAYYKGILLGTSEYWKFTIIEDTLYKASPFNQAYYEFAKHNGDTRLHAVGELKLKYNSENPNDTLEVQLFDDKKNEINLPAKKVALIPGDNRFSIVFDDKVNLIDQNKYVVFITTRTKQVYQVPFTYLNPLYVK